MPWPSRRPPARRSPRSKASVDKASLDLGYTDVVSPIDGLAGTTQVKAGSLVGRGESTLLTTVSQLDPILFRAGISEAEYLRVARRADEMRKERGGQKVPVELDARGRDCSPAEGHPRRRSSGPSTRPRAH